MSKEYVIRKKMWPAGGNPFWDWDNAGKLHMTFMIKMDHEINGDMLIESLKETYDVWPILKEALVDIDGTICFALNDAPIKVHNNKTVVSPGKGINDDRMAAITYYGDTVYVTGMHTFFDGGSAMMILKDVVCRYMKKYYGDDLDVGELPNAGDGDDPEYQTFYSANKRIAEIPYEYKDQIEIIPKVFVDPNMDYGPDYAVGRCVIECPNDEFIAYCKKNGANPSTMLFVMAAKSVFKLNPDNELPFTMNNTMNIRHIFGLDMSIMGQTMGNLLVAQKSDIETPVPEFAKKLRESFDAQREHNYIFSRVEDMRKGKSALAFKLSGSLQYMGSIKYGDANKHIKKFTMYGDLCRNVVAYELNGTFYISLMFGTASKKYADEFLDMLKNAGVSAEITEVTDRLPSEIH